MRKMTWNARKNWIVFFYAILICSIIFSIIFSNLNNTKINLRGEAESAQRALIAQMSQNIDLRLSHIERYLSTLGERAELAFYFSGQSSSDETIRQLKEDIDTLMKSDSSIESIYFYSNKMQTIVSENGLAPLNTFHDTQWLSDAESLSKKREIWTTPRTVNNFRYAETMSIVSLIKTFPLITTPDKIDGYIVININADLLNEIVRSSLPGTESSFLILNMKNEVLFKSQNYFTYDEEKVIEVISNTENSDNFLDNNGTSMLVQYLSATATDWKIVSVTPYTNMASRIDISRNYNIVLGIAVSLFMIITILLSSKWMYAPIDRFMHLIIKNIEKNDNHKISDFEELGDMFLYMAAQQKDLHSQLTHNLPYIKYQMMSDIISGKAVSYEALHPQFSLMKVNLLPANYIILLSDLDDKDIIDVKAPGEDLDVYIASLYNKAEELVNQENKGFSVQLPNQMCVTLMSFEEDNPQSNSVKAIEVAELLSTFMREYYGITITTAIGEYYNDFSEIIKSYQDALNLIKYKSIMGNNSIITMDDVQIRTEIDMQKISLLADKTVRAFESLNQSKTFSLLTEVFEEAKQSCLPSDVIIQIGMQIVRNCMIIYNGQELELNNEHYQNIHISLNQLDTVDEIKDFIGHILAEMLQEMEEKKTVKSSDDLIIKIVEYVDESYSEYNMSLNLLADKFGLSVPYLSKIFKAYTKKTFTDYLIEIRIKKASEMLTSTNKKVNEISEEVGYPNPSSFIRIFKKYHYMTPIDYRNRHRFKEE